MEGKYESIKQLIGLWSDFEAESPTKGYAEFGIWLQNQNREPKRVESWEGEEKMTSEVLPHSGFYNHMNEQRQFLTLLNRASRFLDFYMKKALEGLEISSRLEFQFLISIKEMNEPRKTDVIYFNLVELSTGVEILKRLQQNKLILDFPDESDKRTKRLRVTPKGDELLEKIMFQFEKLDSLCLTFGSNSDWKQFIPLLKAFNEYHTDVFHKHREKNFDVLMKILGI